jgi:hypothetical protein
MLLIVLVAIFLEHRRSKDTTLSRGMNAGCANPDGALVVMDEADRMHTEDAPELEACATDHFHPELEACATDQFDEDVGSINVTPAGLTLSVTSSPVGAPLSRTTSVPSITHGSETTDISAEGPDGKDKFGGTLAIAYI